VPLRGKIVALVVRSTPVRGSSHVSPVVNASKKGAYGRSDWCACAEEWMDA
jgi:hypothetical protein